MCVGVRNGWEGERDSSDLRVVCPSCCRPSSHPCLLFYWHLVVDSMYYILKYTFHTMTEVVCDCRRHLESQAAPACLALWVNYLSGVQSKPHLWRDDACSFSPSAIKSLDQMSWCFLGNMAIWMWCCTRGEVLFIFVELHNCISRVVDTYLMTKYLIFCKLLNQSFTFSQSKLLCYCCMEIVTLLWSCSHTVWYIYSISTIHLIQFSTKGNLLAHQPHQELLFFPPASIAASPMLSSLPFKWCLCEHFCVNTQF